MIQFVLLILLYELVYIGNITLQNNLYIKKYNFSPYVTFIDTKLFISLHFFNYVNLIMVNISSYI